MAESPGLGLQAGWHADAIAASRWLRTDNVLLVALVGLLVWVTGDVLLLVFAGLLLAVGLDGLAGFVTRWTPLSRGWALVVVLVLILAFLAVVGMTIVPAFLGQLDELWQRLIGFADQVYQTLSRYGWVQQLIGEDQGQIAEAAREIVGHAASTLLALLGVIASLVVLLAIAIFTAIDPALYRRGLLSLFRPARRERIDVTLSATAATLCWWFLGQIISMLALGVTVAVGLYILGIELWLSLGVLTGLLTFIPFLGPIIAGIPIIIIGFAESTQTGLIVLIFYLVVQNLEGHVLGPIIQHRAVNLAPAMLISVQILMSALFGLLGFVLAAPLTVAGMVIVNKLYIEDVLRGPR